MTTMTGRAPASGTTEPFPKAKGTALGLISVFEKYVSRWTGHMTPTGQQGCVCDAATSL